MTPIRHWAADTLGLNSDTQLRLLLSTSVIAALVLARWIVLALVRRRIADPRDRYRWHKGSTYLAFLLGAILLARTWLVDFAGFATYLGLLSAGLAIALKDPLTNLAAWLFILWRRPLEVGDRIALGDYAGDVVDIRLFQFTLLEIGRWVAADQTTGRLVHIPNAMLFATPLANYTRGFEFIWTELPVLVTFESDWRKARDLLQEIATRHGTTAAERAGTELAAAAQRYALPQSAIEPAVYLSVEDSGVLLTLRIPCLPRERRQVTDAVWQDVLDAFASSPTIDLAYPTTRWYANDREGKPAMRPPASP
ncbi:MAG TPA: mechanosensitive ion channel domain-containing protein [Gemmatimonadales bacterium]|nr:mechanosensitive ion channel domain-containing protein [Gemmatimonadales bacterium]